MELSATFTLPSIPKPSSLSSSNSLYFNNNLTSTHLSKKPNTLTLNRARSGFNCRSMFGLGVPEIVVIAGVTTLLFGPKMVPQLGKSIGQTVKGFQEAAKEFESELKKSQSESEVGAIVVSEEQLSDPKISTDDNILG
ncbi:hypothetical protein ACHQM5_027656 [Ranunculus cassubicifolius]